MKANAPRKEKERAHYCNDVPPRLKLKLLNLLQTDTKDKVDQTQNDNPGTLSASKNTRLVSTMDTVASRSGQQSP